MSPKNKKTVSAEFRQFYSTFSAHYTKENWPAIFNMIPEINPKEYDLNALTFHETILRGTMVAVIKLNDNQDAKIEHICNCYLKLLEVFEPDDTISFLDTFNRLSNRIGFPFSKHKEWFSGFLKLIQKRVKSITKSDPIKLFPSITKAILLFVKMESNQTFEASLRLIKWCQDKLFADDNLSPYKHAFNLISMAVKICTKEKNVDNYAAQLYDGLQSRNKSGPLKSMNQDTAITIIEIIHFSIRNTLILVKCPPTNAFVSSTLDSLLVLYDEIRSATSDKIVCSQCNDVKRHISIYIGNIGYQLIKEKGFFSWPLHILKIFIKVFLQKLMILQTLKCQTASTLQQSSDVMIQKLFTVNPEPNCDKELLKFGQMFLLRILKDRGNLIACNIDSKFFVKKIVEINESLEQWQRAINGKVLQIVMHLANDDRTSNTLINEVYQLCQIQKKLPEDQFIDVIYKNLESKYLDCIDVPVVNGIDLLNLQYRISIRYKILTEEQNKDIMLRILNATGEPMKRLECLYYCKNYDSDSTINRLLKNAIKQISKLKTIQSFSLRATYETFVYLQNFTKIKESQKEKSIKFLVDESDDLAELSITFESSLIKTLDNALTNFQQFIELYKRTKEQTNFLAETQSALRNLNIIGTHFILRLCREKAAQAFRLVYILSKMIDEELDTLNAISFFAEHPIYFGSLFPCENLGQIIVEQDNICIQYLDNLMDLSMRKRQTVLLYMLSLTEFYMAQWNLKAAQNLLKIVDRKLIELEQKYSNSTSVVRCKYFSVMFNMLAKYLKKTPITPLLFAEYVLDSCKSIVYLTEDDQLLIPIVLSNLLVNLATYCLARYEFLDIEFSIKIALKMVFRLGMVANMAQLFGLLGLISLHLRNVSTSDKTRQYLEQLLEISTNAEQLPIPKKQANGTMACNRTHLSPIRNVNTHALSPVRIISRDKSVTICRYISAHNTNCSCPICTNSVYKMISFKLALIASQLDFIKDEHESSLHNFEYLYKYWETTARPSIKDPLLEQEYDFFVIRMLCFYAYNLWKMKRTKETRIILELAYKRAQSTSNIDFAIRQDIAQQIFTLDHSHRFDGKVMDN